MTHPIKIFYAEDSEDDAFFMCRAVVKSGLPIELTVWPDGSAIIAALKAELPHIVILDLQMPGATGLEVLAWLRSSESPAKELPAIIFSSSNLAADVAEAYRLMANAFVVKTGNGEQWVSVISGIYAVVAEGMPADRLAFVLPRG